MDGPPLGSPRMSGATESEQRAQCERRVERTEASNVIVRAGSDRISEWRIMSDNARTNDAPAGPSGGRLDPLAKVFTPKVRDERDFYVREREWEPEREQKMERVRNSVSACDDDNVSVSTDASCFSDLSLESVPTPAQDLRWGSTTVYKNKIGGSVVHIYEFDPEDDVPVVHDLQDLLQEQQIRRDVVGDSGERGGGIATKGAGRGTRG